MPRSPAVHYNSPDEDEYAACGRKLAKVKWDIQPARVTCPVEVDLGPADREALKALAARL